MRARERAHKLQEEGSPLVALRITTRKKAVNIILNPITMTMAMKTMKMTMMTINSTTVIIISKTIMMMRMVTLKNKMKLMIKVKRHLLDLTRPAVMALKMMKTEASMCLLHLHELGLVPLQQNPRLQRLLIQKASQTKGPLRNPTPKQQKVEMPKISAVPRVWEVVEEVVQFRVT
jgi:hypothetical protein